MRLRMRLDEFLSLVVESDIGKMERVMAKYKLSREDRLMLAENKFDYTLHRNGGGGDEEHAESCEEI